MIALKIRVVCITLAMLCLTIKHCDSFASPQTSNNQTLRALNDSARRVYQMGNFDEAKQILLHAVRTDPDYPETYNNLGILLKNQGKLDEALLYYNQAERIFNQDLAKNKIAIARLYINKGIIYKNKGDYYQALKYYNNILDVLVGDTSEDARASLGKAYVNLGIVYLKQGNDSAALDVFLKSVELKKDVSPRDLPVTYANIASAYTNLGRFELADSYYQKSIDKRKELWDSTYHLLAGTYTNQAYIKYLLNEKDDAERLFEKAHWLVNFNFDENSAEHAPVWRVKGNMHLADNNYTRALECYHNALFYEVEGFSDPDVLTDPDLELLNADIRVVETLSNKALSAFYVYSIDQDKKYLSESLRIYDLLNQLIEKIRSGYLDEESKMLMIQNSRDILNQALNVAYKAYEIDKSKEIFNKALEFAEKSKAALLSSALSDDINKQNYGIPVEVQWLEKDIIVETDFYEKKVYQELQKDHPDSSKVSAWQGKLLALSQSYDSLLHVMQDDFPEYYRMKYDKKVAGIKDIKKSLRRNSALVEYSLTDSLLYTFVVGRNDFELFRYRVDSSFYKLIDNVVNVLRDNRFGNIRPEQFEEYLYGSNKLYQMLIGRSKIIQKGMRLTIIPDNQLGYLPFEALLTNIPEDQSFEFRTLAYMVYDFAVNYSYSATMLVQQETKKSKKEIQAIAFAPAYSNVDDIDSAKFLASRDFKDQLVPLRFAIDELQGIKEIVNSDLYLNEDANEVNFWEFAPAYDIIHFAMHTLMNEDDPMYSQLVFSLNNDTVEKSDGLLNAYEIYNADLNARLAVLSACNTGYGRLHKGEGVMSIARGFFYAGVPTVVMTLWAVLDQSGAILMKNFYSFLAEGEDIDIALQKAKIQYLSTADEISAHPYLWSGYVAIGNPSSIYPSPLSIYQVAIIAAISILFILVVFIMLKKKKKPLGD